MGYLKRLFPCITHTTHPGAIKNFDVWGPAPADASKGCSYFVLLVDDCTCMSWEYFLKHKFEIFDVFVKFYNMLITQFQTQPQIFRSDNGWKYINLDMKNFISISLIHQPLAQTLRNKMGFLSAKIIYSLR